MTLQMKKKDKKRLGNKLKEKKHGEEAKEREENCIINGIKHIKPHLCGIETQQMFKEILLHLEAKTLRDASRPDVLLVKTHCPVFAD